MILIGDVDADLDLEIIVLMFRDAHGSEPGPRGLLTCGRSFDRTVCVMIS